MYQFQKPLRHVGFNVFSNIFLVLYFCKLFCYIFLLVVKKICCNLLDLLRLGLLKYITRKYKFAIILKCLLKIERGRLSCRLLNCFISIKAETGRPLFNIYAIFHDVRVDSVGRLTITIAALHL